MADLDPTKHVLKQPGAPENAESIELSDDDLKAVTGGLSNSMGAGLSSLDTAVCVSSD